MEEVDNKGLFNLAYRKLELDLEIVQDKFNLLKSLESVNSADWTSEHSEILENLANK